MIYFEIMSKTTVTTDQVLQVSDDSDADVKGKLRAEDELKESKSE